ncbi:hypothetical protein AB0K71_05910 [Streptomyces syringium]|uniref:hypothetical protein n=1 Tax=Streptomyces syringium TaxID=76729 RepID=UPI0034160824
MSDPLLLVRCPIADCPARRWLVGLHDHLAYDHDPADLIDRLIQLAPALTQQRGPTTGAGH